MALTCGRALLALLAVYVAILSHTLLELFYPSPCRGAACLQPLLRSGAAVDLQAHIDGRLVWSAAGVSSGAGLEDVAFAVPVPAESAASASSEQSGVAVSSEQSGVAVSSEQSGVAVSSEQSGVAVSSEQSGVAPPNERGEVPHYLYAAASLELRLVADETPHAGPVLPSDGAVVANGVDWSRRVYAPRLYVDELGLLGKHALPLSSDVGKEPPRLRLRLLPISLGRYRATRQLHTALGALQAASGMEAAEFDELRELLSEKRLYRFALMQLIGLLHVVFDALAFRNDVGFWKGREDLRGLSSRGVIFNAGSTLVIFLYLLDGDGVNSIVLATYAFSTALELWKLTKMKSVAHLPWRVLAYKAFNTFIDDAFALMVAMPTAHRVACLRDDLVFLVLLYQRRLYPVDRKRANEFGIAYERDEADQKSFE
ncbi:hypothetical protein EMIHUDRAFT_199533 [Emiliania huxleyi CCMP1516]|uniref:Uncharacterized protein n=2 Tax=Emiliania huxleyi TaxID=2903 RepID=A0A0D3KZS3_EMIH1|nr:hypothetical protein EMIHUDRAFT_199533 [Emiliania huxleyi CCMP1516]EOD41258.1 hypothetical protein EMIHUDRAFT_199533 [Emiliania huxleyi CCMP1516]|eukprot:XP_005793687.1 hypothetical protein EMIHUDRAFT_199533 [Emiliania huxleyi CCMP1516]